MPPPSHKLGENISAIVNWINCKDKPLIPIKSNEIPKEIFRHIVTSKSCIQDETKLDPMDVEN
ncbi:hypothetical protein EJB05_27788, partial [Eragrostis curvula]